jgi:hypothetical protein
MAVIFMLAMDENKKQEGTEKTEERNSIRWQSMRCRERGNHQDTTSTKAEIHFFVFFVSSWFTYVLARLRTGSEFANALDEAIIDRVSESLGHATPDRVRRRVVSEFVEHEPNRPEYADCLV